MCIPLAVTESPLIGLKHQQEVVYAWHWNPRQLHYATDVIDHGEELTSITTKSA